MCGICGVFHYSSSRQVSRDEIARMNDVLIHRGPDGEGVYVSSDRRVGLGARRLAIIDPTSAGAQPMRSAGGVTLVYNGELYNAPELRMELLSQGFSLESSCDTEILLRCYERDGVECLQYLDGIFAFAIWDEPRQRFFAARDHIGVKPLYYALHGGTLVVGSEIKAILAANLIPKALESSNLPQYLAFGCLPAPLTLFRHVHKLPAAHRLLIDRTGTVSVERYWDPVSGNPYLNRAGSTEAFFVDEVRKGLTDSVKGQVRSDVPIACSLSGGVDSSAIAVLMSRFSPTPVNTYSIGFEEHARGYNEFEHAQRINDRIAARSRSLMVSHSDVVDFVRDIYPGIADDPNADPVCCLAYFISRAMKADGISVALSGEGADEIFTGYADYLTDARYARTTYARLAEGPRALWSALGPSSPTLYKLLDGQPYYWGNAIAFLYPQVGRLLGIRRNEPAARALCASVRTHYDDLEQLLPETDQIQRQTYLELKLRLVELLLMRVDKMTMANSVEYRVPFVDRRLVELGLAIPEALKVRADSAKHILKKSVEDLIPQENIWRKKMGFAVPIREWLATPAKAKPFLEVVLEGTLCRTGVLDRRYVLELIEEHAAGRADHDFRLWTLVTLSAWYDRWF